MCLYIYIYIYIIKQSPRRCEAAPPPPDNLRRGDANFPFLRRICVASASATQTFHFYA